MKLNELNAAIEKYHNNVGKIRKAMSGIVGRGINALTGYDFSQSTQVAALEKYLQTKFSTTASNPDVSLADFEKTHGELSKTFLTSGSESAKLFIDWVASDARLEEKQAESKQNHTSMQLIPTGENAFALPVLGVKSDSRNLLGTVCRYIAAQNGDVISFSHFGIDESHPLYQATQLRIEPASTTLADSQLGLGAFNILLLMIVKPHVVYSMPPAGRFDLTLDLSALNCCLHISEILQAHTASIESHKFKFKPALTPLVLERALDFEPLSLPASIATQNRASSFGDFDLGIEGGPALYYQNQSVLFSGAGGLPRRPVDGESGLYALPRDLMSGGEISDTSSISDDELSELSEQEFSNFRRSSF